ncbi:DJ-1 family glyoxalase III [Malaciobacter sp. WC5094]
MAKIIVPISNGFEEIEAVSIIDICRRAGVEVCITGVESLETQGANSIKIIADCMIDEVNANNFDMIVLPGGLPNAFTLAENEKVQELLKTMKKDDKYIAAICAAPYALHTADVLNTNYTCYPSFEQKIRDEGYTSTQDVVEDGKVITSRGPGTATTFALKLVETLCGNETYENVKNGLLAK